MTGTTGGNTNNHHHHWHEQWGVNIIIAPVILPAAGAYVETVPGQCVLPVGYRVPERVTRVVETESRLVRKTGCPSLSVASVWNGVNDPTNPIQMSVEARNCLPNHTYAVAAFSGEADWAKKPTALGTIQTDKDGYALQDLQYSPGTCPTLDMAVGLYEFEGDNLVAGPMVQAFAGKLGSPTCPQGGQ
jgi:hypothetical protein